MRRFNEDGFPNGVFAQIGFARSIPTGRDQREIATSRQCVIRNDTWDWLSGKGGAPHLFRRPDHLAGVDGRVELIGGQ